MTKGLPHPRRSPSPLGALVNREGVHFRVWAPDRDRVSVVFDRPVWRDATPRAPNLLLAPEPGGYFSGTAAVREGTRYWYRLDEDDTLYADPASRWQPDGPHGPSAVVDSSRFSWSDTGWKGPSRQGLVIYELHVGTFTSQGTWRAAVDRLDALTDLGITMIEMMPVNEFPGRFGWGYDGVNLFAPTRLYGEPDDLRAFVDAAHARGLAVILDVVYNHFGPDGCFLDRFAADYFARQDTEWGRAINFDGPQSEHVRAFFVQNAAYWIRDFHFDGLRIDATHAIHDSSSPHIVAEVAAAARQAAGSRPVYLVAENEPQHSEIARPVDRGGDGLDALWNDDYHHTALVALTGRREAYYTDYLGSAQELVSALTWGFLYQGQRYAWQDQARGHPALDLPPWAFVVFLENHDQVANTLGGERLHQLTSPAKFRALTALTLLAPATPMLFQGQEFGATSPFLFFADHAGELAEAVRTGRRDFLSQFPSLSDRDALHRLAAPDDPQTFARSRLDWAERDRHRPTVALHRDLLALRRRDPAFDATSGARIHGAVLGAGVFLIRFFAGIPGERPEDDRLLIVNLGAERHFEVIPEPLIAPPAGLTWAAILVQRGRGVPGAWRVPAAIADRLAPAR